MEVSHCPELLETSIGAQHRFVILTGHLVKIQIFAGKLKNILSSINVINKKTIV